MHKGNSNIYSFCKKPGQLEQSYFAKERAKSPNKRKVNLRTLGKNSDLTTAVIQGNPIDVLIDSGALDEF